MSQLEYFIDSETQKEIGFELWKMRQEKRLLLRQVHRQTNIPEKIIDGIETGRYINYGMIRRLIKFYGKKMRIVFD